MNLAKIPASAGTRLGAESCFLLLSVLLWQGCAEPKARTAQTPVPPVAPPAPARATAPIVPTAAVAPTAPTTPVAPAARSVASAGAALSASTNAAASAAFPAGIWKELFDGKTLKGWAVTDFAGHGEVRVDAGRILLEMGVMTGITWTSSLPRINYELELEAMRVEGSDFFCGLTFPVGESPCSLIVGGWGGGVVGLSSLDGEDAANNETTKYINFEKGRWYKVRLRVTPTAIQAWIDQDKVVDVVTTDRAISIRMEVELSRPLGLSSWSTTAALRNLRMRAL